MRSTSKAGGNGYPFPELAQSLGNRSSFPSDDIPNVLVCGYEERLGDHCRLLAAAKEFEFYGQIIQRACNTTLSLIADASSAVGNREESLD
jgi:hypothetical protein